MVSPKSVGVNKKGIYDFLTAVEKAGLEIHRLMILRYGKCIAKVTWEPYKEEQLHPLYSFSKSITATAIGFARQEGLLSLDEKLVDIFPEDLPKHPSEYLKRCTIHHLLCMSCGQETEIEDRGANWRKTFFAHPFLHEPGTFFKYNTAGSNVLSSIIKKKTGQDVTEYLRPRLLDPLGIKEIFSYHLADDLHTQIGGSGMKMSLEDMAKFTQFMLQDGWWEGKTLLKDWYFARAGKKQMETEGDSENHVQEWANGYGYQCWMGEEKDSFRADGAFGQFGLVYPNLDLCIITNAATEQTQTMIDAVNECIIPNVDAFFTFDKENKVVASENEAEGNAIVMTKSLQPLSSCHNPLFEEILNHSVYEVNEENKMSGILRLIGGAGILQLEEESSISSIRFHFEEENMTLYFTERGVEKSILVALNRCFALSQLDGITLAGTGRWRSLRKLQVEVRRLDAMSGVYLTFKFEGKEGEILKIEADETLMTDGGLGMIEKTLVDFHQVANLDGIEIEKTGNNPAVISQNKK